MNKLLVFDLDGVLIDSKKNMKYSWKKTALKFGLKIPFSKYFKNIGIPFQSIMRKLSVKNSLKVEQYYSLQSKKNTHLISIYPGVRRFLKKIKKKYYIAVITSKDQKRTNYIIKKKIKISFNRVKSPVPKIKWKPHPYSMTHLLNDLKISKENAFYIGDTKIDKEFAKNSKVKFIYAKYGYGNLKQKGIKKIFELNKFI